MRFGLNTAPLGHKVLRFHDQCCMSRRISRITEGGVRVDLPHHLLQPFSFVALGVWDSVGAGKTVKPPFSLLKIDLSSPVCPAASEKPRMA